MTDGRKNNGGARKGAGRKPKADEIKLIEKLDKHINQDDVILIMKGLIEQGNTQVLKMYMEYRFGKPKEVVENINRNYDAGKLTKEEVEMLNKVIEDKY